MARRQGQFERTIEQAERDGEIARYKVGRSYRETARHFKMPVATVHAAVTRALRGAVAEGAEALRSEEGAKLDALEFAAWEVLRGLHVTVSNGRVVYDPSSREPVPDTGPVLAAMSAILRIQERRARLFGLDAPARSEVTVITEDVVDANIRRLEAELASADRGGSAVGEAGSAAGVAAPQS